METAADSRPFAYPCVIRVRPIRGIRYADKWVKRFRMPLQQLTRYYLTTRPEDRHVFPTYDATGPFADQFKAEAARFVIEPVRVGCGWRSGADYQNGCQGPIICNYQGVLLCDPHWRDLMMLVDDGKDVEVRRRLGKRRGERCQSRMANRQDNSLKCEG